MYNPATAKVRCYGTQNAEPFIRAEKHLILTAPDTEFENFLSELDQLSEREPEILDKIEQDLEKYARNKKKERLDGINDGRKPGIHGFLIFP